MSMYARRRNISSLQTSDGTIRSFFSFASTSVSM